jgi:hypothetical protein
MAKKARITRHPAIVSLALFSWVVALKLLVVEVAPSWRLWAAGIITAVVVVVFIDLDQF